MLHLSYLTPACSKAGLGAVTAKLPSPLWTYCGSFWHALEWDRFKILTLTYGESIQEAFIFGKCSGFSGWKSYYLPINNIIPLPPTDCKQAPGANGTVIKNKYLLGRTSWGLAGQAAMSLVWTCLLFVPLWKQGVEVFCQRSVCEAQDGGLGLQSSQEPSGCLFQV